MSRTEESGGRGKCYGSATVGPRGQIVIPSQARKELGIEAGSTLLVFAHPMAEGLWLMKAEMVEELVGRMSARLADLEKQVKKYTKGSAAEE